MTDHAPEGETQDEILERQQGKGYGEDEGERGDALASEGEDELESPIEGP